MPSKKCLARCTFTSQLVEPEKFLASVKRALLLVRLRQNFLIAASISLAKRGQSLEGGLQLLSASHHRPSQGRIAKSALMRLKRCKDDVGLRHVSGDADIRYPVLR